MSKKDRYVTAITYPPEKLERLKGLMAYLDYPIHQFIAEAVDNEIDYRLKKMPDNERAIVETIIENRLKKLQGGGATPAADAIMPGK